MNPNTGSSNNWVLIKIIKLFGCLIPHEPRLGKKLEEPLKNLINNTSAMSLLYECINTLIQVLKNFLIGSKLFFIALNFIKAKTYQTSGGDNETLIQLCVDKLRILIEDNDQNLKYLGLLSMIRILGKFFFIFLKLDFLNFRAILLVENFFLFFYC